MLLVSSSAHGKIAEHLAIVELTRRGHRIALPVTDDDGVDLIVDYRTTVQVKNANRTVARPNGYEYTGYTWSNNRARWNADVFLLHAYEDSSSRWWVVPTSVLVELGAKSSLNLRNGSRGIGGAIAAHEDRWDIFRSPQPQG